jgi:PIN domain nuclease of toxin-antitoxin system
VERPPVRYLLDTAPWINGVTLPETLPLRIRRLVEGDDKKGLCSVSLLEAAILHRLGRLQFDGSLADLFAAGLSADVQLLEPTPAIAARTNELPRDYPGDPFDRTIIATAAILDLTLVTTDPAMRDAGACAVEYYPFTRSRRKRKPRPDSRS